MHRSNGNVQSRDDRGSNQNSLQAKKGKGSEKRREDSVNKTKGDHKRGGTSYKELVSLDNSALSSFWHGYKINEAQLTLFRFVFFIVLAIDSFEQLPRTYKITGPPGHPNINLPHFPLLFSLFPSPSPSLLMGAWICSFFLSAKMAFGVGGRLEVLILALLKGYTVFVSQVDNYQHHYLTVLLLFILANIPWNSLGKAKECSWPIRLLLVQLSIVYFWTAVAKLDSRWTSGEVLPYSLGPEFVSYINNFGQSAWPLLSIGTIVAELFLTFFLQFPSFHLFAFLIGVPMHILMGISGLQIGRFSEVLVALYILVIPTKVFSFLPNFPDLTKMIPSNIVVKTLLYISSFTLLLFSKVADVLPVALYVLLGLFILDICEHFSEKQKRYFPFQVLASLALVYLCFRTPYLRDTYLNAGTAALQYRDLNTSIQFFQKAITVDPYHAETYGDLGLFLESTKYPAEAEKMYTNVLENLDKDNLKALVGMMRVSDNKKDREEVCKYVSRAGPLAHKAVESQTQCVSQECTRVKGHASYVLNAARQLNEKWSCDQ